MTRPKVRIGTLMLLVVIAALAVALLIQGQDAAVLRSERDRAIERAETLEAKIDLENHPERSSHPEQFRRSLVDIDREVSRRMER